MKIIWRNTVVKIHRKMEAIKFNPDFLHPTVISGLVPMSSMRNDKFCWWKCEIINPDINLLQRSYNKIHIKPRILWVWTSSSIILFCFGFFVKFINVSSWSVSKNAKQYWCCWSFNLVNCFVNSTFHIFWLQSFLFQRLDPY